MFIGEIYHQIDEKGRIRIPAKFKDELGKNPFITKGTDKCLFVYPREVADSVFLSKFQGNDFADREKTKALRYLMSSATFAEEDKQGRILLPQNLIAHASIKKNIVTIGAYDRIEIWSEDCWREYLAGSDFDQCLEALKEDNK